MIKQIKNNHRKKYSPEGYFRWKGVKHCVCWQSQYNIQLLILMISSVHSSSMAQHTLASLFRGSKNIIANTLEPQTSPGNVCGCWPQLCFPLRSSRDIICFVAAPAFTDTFPVVLKRASARLCNAMEKSTSVQRRCWQSITHHLPCPRVSVRWPCLMYQTNKSIW